MVWSTISLDTDLGKIEDPKEVPLVQGGSPPGPSEGGRRPTGDGPGLPGDEKPRRFSARRKVEIVLRLLRGEDVELRSRELNVTAARLSKWREQFLRDGRALLSKRPQDARDLEIARLQQKLGEVTMDNELLQKKSEHLEDGRPLPRGGRSTLCPKERLAAGT